MFFFQAISLIAVKEQDALIHASSIAEESLLFIETVKIFEGQQQEMTRSAIQSIHKNMPIGTYHLSTYHVL